MGRLASLGGQIEGKFPAKIQFLVLLSAKPTVKENFYYKGRKFE